MSDNNNMETTALMNIANSNNTPQSFEKSIARVFPLKKQAVIKALARKSGIIHSEKQPSNNVSSNETAQFIKNFFTCLDIVYNAMHER